MDIIIIESQEELDAHLTESGDFNKECHLVLKCDIKIDGDIALYGGMLISEGCELYLNGAIDTGGGSIYTNGGRLYFKENGNIKTQGGGLFTQGGCIYLESVGDIRTCGGTIDLNGGSLWMSGEVHTEGGNFYNIGGVIGVGGLYTKGGIVIASDICTDSYVDVGKGRLYCNLIQPSSDTHERVAYRFGINLEGRCSMEWKTKVASVADEMLRRGDISLVEILYLKSARGDFKH